MPPTLSEISEVIRLLSGRHADALELRETEIGLQICAYGECRLSADDLIEDAVTIKRGGACCIIYL